MTIAPLRTRLYDMVDPEARRQLEWLEAAVDDMAAQTAENAHRLDEMEQVQSGIIDLLETNHERRSRLEGHVSRLRKAKALELG